MVCPVKCAMPCISSCIFKDIGSLWGSGMRFRKVILAFPARHFDLTTNFYELNSKLEGIGCCCSVTKSCPAVCNSMDCSTPGFPVLHQLPKLAQTHVHQVGDAIQPPLSSPSTHAFNLSQHRAGSFPMSWLFASGGQMIGASASALPMNIQG